MVGRAFFMPDRGLAMASPFDALDAALSASCMSAFGEAATLRPRKASQYTERAADPARPSATISGVYSAGPGDVPIKGASKGGEFQGPTRFATMRAEFWISSEDIACIPYKIAVGDLITLTDRGGLSYEVVSAQVTDLGDVNLIIALDDISAA
jgi:hypothetical protein